MAGVTPKKGETDERSEGNCYVALTHDHLDVLDIMNRVRSPKAGAIVLFAGTHP
jgi:molybdopterin synthase catalytic subunit